METPMKKIVRMAVLAATAATLSGCAATEVALEHHNLETQTKMSNTVFLPPSPPSEHTVYVQFHNTSDKPLGVASLKASLEAQLENEGYRVVPYDQAHYLLQINVLSIGKTNPAAAQQALGAGFGGALYGAAAGVAIGQSYPAGLAGGLVGGAGSLIADSLVHNTTYAMVTDVQVGVRSKHLVSQSTNANLQQGTSTTTSQSTSEVGHWVDYRTRIVSTANQVNLDFKSAAPKLEGQLVHSLSGIF
jgi:hypothetical protein